MTNQRLLKFALLAALAAFVPSCEKPTGWHATDVTGTLPDLSFTLTGPAGDEVEARSMRGRPVLLFFGFTNCPGVCPTTLRRLKVIMERLGPQAARLQALLVTVDPERDTPRVMQNYTAPFGPWLLGLTGPENALAALRRQYGVYAAMQTSPDRGQYDVMHSTAIFAFDAAGRARLLLSDLSDIDSVVADLRRLIEE